MTEVYDFAAIGAGPAGESAAELAAFYGRRSVVIEKNRPGGTVTTTGGAPTKTLREAALYLTGFRDRNIYGLQMATVPDVVLPTIRKRTREVSELLQRVTADNIAKHSVDYLQGYARFGPGRTLLVTTSDGCELTVQPNAILIASGSRPMRPKGIPFDDPGVCDSDTILALDYIPKDILIVGGGPVGVEYATICHALGAHVTLVADRFMPELAGAGLTEEQCQAQGIDYALGRSEFDLIPRGAIAGRSGLLKLIFRRDNQKLIGLHCIGDLASELVGIGQMVIHFAGTLSVFDEVSMNTPTYSYTYKYAAFDALRRLRNARPYDRSVRDRIVPSYGS